LQYLIVNKGGKKCINHHDEINKSPSFIHGIVAFLVSVGEGTPRKLATATQPQFPRKTADFKQQLVSRLAGAQ
jgi:bifunctional ADP-heptose synthase (sugar kinase/adenylyltransferase)